MKKLLKAISKCTSRTDVIPLLKEAGCFYRVCEVGVREGKHLKHMYDNNPGLLVGVDIWKDDGVLSHNDMALTNEYLENCHRELVKWTDGKTVELVRKYSVDAAADYPDEYFDYVHIDADHTYDAVLADLNAWWPKVKVGGVISGHDYIANKTLKSGVTFGVIEAVAEFRKQNGNPPMAVTAEKKASFFMIKENHDA